MESSQKTTSQELTTDETQSAQSQLSNLFGSYRAEWLHEQLFDLYTSPVYFPELTTGRSCMLIGGRGTGKTTALRALSWEGQRRLQSEQPASWSFFGVYYRVDTNRVTAFKGPELSTDRWNALFGHYFNLLVCERLVDFAQWVAKAHPKQELLEPDRAEEISISLSVENTARSLDDLAVEVRRSRLTFEAYINNVADATSPSLSLQGAPIETFMQALSAHPDLSGRPFFIIIDEYENFLDEQQRVVNTLVKHATSLFAFKIGVRELGWRQRTTLNEHEQLRSPADFVRIDIAQKLENVFSDFAVQICDDRISRLAGRAAEGSLGSIRALFPPLSEDDEASLLNVERHVTVIRDELEPLISESELAIFDSLPMLYRYLIGFWARGHNQTVVEAFRDYLKSPSEWNTRYGNYKHSLLYTLKRRVRGVHKYYAGWDTLAQVAGTNIRFFLQLVEQSLLQHLKEGRTFGTPLRPATQTTAAQLVGRSNLSELEGLSVYGMYLSRLVLGLGRVFQVMAEQAEGHAPETNQFYLVDDSTVTARRARSGIDDEAALQVDTVLTEAVMHLALVRFPGTKPTQAGDTEEYDYMLHPIFSPLFAYSYRKKRKTAIGRLQLLALVRNPRPTIREILAESSRTMDFDDELPDQLALFGSFYRGGS